jgi:ABC-2 type transport system permease protein
MSLKNILNKKNRALLRELVVTDFKLRYQGSVLGYLWSLLKPLFLFAILYAVFGHFLRFGDAVEHFPLYLLLGIVLWGFFAEATSQGLSAIVARGDLIRKVNFPKYVIVISGTLSALINLVLNMIVVFIFMIISKVDLHPNVWMFPFVLLELYVLAVAIAFFLSAAFVRYRDISHIWEVATQALFYATPVIYPLSLVMAQSEVAAKVLMLSPVAQIIQDARYTLITPQTPTVYSLVHNPFLVAVPFALVVVCVALAVVYFRKRSKYFAEDI